MQRRAFTLVELLVVIAIIAILAGLTTVVVTMLGKRQKAATTAQTMEQLQAAISLYLEDDRLLGDADTSGKTDFSLQAAQYLAELTGQMTLKRLATDQSGTDAGPFIPAKDFASATHFRDGYGDVVYFQVTNELMQGSTDHYYTSEVLMRSKSGTNQPKDDLVYQLDMDYGDWVKVKLTGIDGSGIWQIDDE